MATKWNRFGRVRAAVRRHACDLLASLLTGDDTGECPEAVKKELVDIALIAELVGVTPALLAERRVKFLANMDKPALVPMDDVGAEIAAAIIAPDLVVTQLYKRLGFNDVELGQILRLSDLDVQKQHEHYQAAENYCR